MTDINLYNLEGKVIGKVSLPDELAAAKVTKSVIHEVLRAEEAAARLGTAQTKTRSFVSGGGKKPWKQKHTGRARHGSTRSPIWKGGGVVFGPHPRDYAFKVNRKVRQQALAGVFTSRVGEERMVALDCAALTEPATGRMAGFLKHFAGVKKPLLVHTKEDGAATLSMRNIRDAKLKNVRSLNVRTLISSDFIILTRGAAQALAEKATQGAES